MSHVYHVIRQDSQYTARDGARVLGTFKSRAEADAAIIRDRKDRFDARVEQKSKKDEKRTRQDAALMRVRADSKGLTGEPEDQEEENGEDADEDAEENLDRAMNGKDLPMESGDDQSAYGTPGSGRGGAVDILTRVRDSHKDMYDSMSPRDIVDAYKAARRDLKTDMDNPKDVTHTSVMDRMTKAPY